MAKVNGILTSKWDGNGARFDTKAILDTETGAVESLEFISGDALEGLSCLTDEFFTSGDDKYQVCETCHEFITKRGSDGEPRCMGGCDD